MSWRSFTFSSKSALGIIVVSLCLSAGVLLPQTTSSLEGSDFQAGRIMDDEVFFNPNTMSLSQIQEFLNAKVPICDTDGTQPYAGTTRADYSASKGYYPPFTCLKDYRQDTVNKSAESGMCNGHTAGNKSGAQIIYEVAQSCGVSPKVLLVLLQKEQSLITDDWPWSTQYRSATGYGCPDTAPCDAEYYGFFNQVYMAARQFKRYALNPANYNYRKDRNNFIQYNPNSSCGGGEVYIRNQATAGLYNYTPYQPNAAALNNLYGLGDSCSAYGNRNFWRMYSDWFGNTFNAPFNWQTVNMTIYDEGKNTVLATDNLRPGERVFVSLKVKNTGSETWYRDGPNPILLGTDRSPNHDSKYCDTTWLRCNRPAKLREESLATGQVGHFEFYAAASNDLGEFREYFRPVLEGRAWMTNDTGFHIYTRTIAAFPWEWLSYDAWTDQTKTTRVDINNLSKGQNVYITMRARNTTATIWRNNGPNPLKLGTSAPQDRASILCKQGWLSCNRPVAQLEESVVPGQVATFAFTIKAPAQTGEYREYFKPVLEYRSWMLDNPHHIYLRVTH